MMDEPPPEASDAVCATHGAFNGPSCPKCDQMDAEEEEKQGWTHTRLVAAVRARYQREGYAFMSNVPSRLGFNSKRYADGIAVGLWESRGFEVVGFEVKASRSDFLRELKDPPKADDIFGYCDRWFLVAANDGIVNVDAGELPSAWGLMVPRGRNLTVVTKAPKLSPQPLERSFLCALLRRAHEQMESKSAQDEAYQRGWEEGRLKGEKTNNGTLYYLRQEHERLKKSVKAFHEKSGIHIDSYDGGQVGAVAKALFEKDFGGLQDNLRRMEQNLTEALGKIREAKEELKGARKP